MLTATQLTPAFDRVIVRPDEAESVSKGGIVLPETSKQRPCRGVIIAIGRGKRNEDGGFVDPVFEAGQHVIFKRYQGAEVEVDEDKLVILDETDVLAVID